MSHSSSHTKVWKLPALFFCEGSTSVKCSTTDLCQTVWNTDIRKRKTFMECTGIDLSQSIREKNGNKGITAFKRISTDLFRIIRQNDQVDHILFFRRKSFFYKDRKAIMISFYLFFCQFTD